MKKTLSACIAMLALASCYTTRAYVGNVKPNDPVVKVNKVTNNFFLWGLAPGGHAEVNASDYVSGKTDYVVETQESFVNGLLSTITWGIYSPRTTTFYLPANSK